MAAGTKENAKYEHLEPKVVKDKMELSCDLNDVEWQNRARELAEAHKAVEEQNQRKKDVMAELNADIKLAATKESKLANIVATRREQREVVVETVHDYESGIITTRRTDTDEVIGRREMTTNERQQGLSDHEAEEEETYEASDPENIEETDSGEFAE